MARPRGDGLPSQKPNKRRLTDQFIGNISSEKRHLVWDTRVGGLALAVSDGAEGLQVPNVCDFADAKKAAREESKRRNCDEVSVAP